MSPTELAILAPVLAGAIVETLHLDPDRALAMNRDFTVLLTSHANGHDTTAALVDLTTTFADTAAVHSGNRTIVNAEKILSNFPAAHASAIAGQAVVLASPVIEGIEYLMTLERKGGPAAESLGV
jgi:hypothetical protein